MKQSFCSSLYASLLALAIAALSFSACQQNPPQLGGEAAAGSNSAAAANIVFIYADSILAKYDVFQEKGAELAKREQEETAKLQQKGKAIEDEVRAIQSKVQQGLLAPNQIAREEQRIGQKQQELMIERERISQELMMESQKLNEELQEKLITILKDLQAEKGYDYILSYGPGTAVLMVNDELDITDEVLSRLNVKKEVQ
jgi:outer membrane protein